MTSSPAAAASPALRQLRMRAFDPAAMARALQGGQLEHVQLQRGVFEGEIVHSSTGDSRLDWGHYGLSVLARGDLSVRNVTIGLALAGDGDWRGHGQLVAPGDIVLFPERGDLLVALPPHSQWLTLQVPRERLEGAGLAMASGLGGAARHVPGLLSTDLRHTLVRLGPVLAPGARTAGYEAADVALAHADLLNSLLAELAQRESSGGSAVPLTPGARWQLVRRVEDHLQALGHPLVRMDELCVATGTSLSRLERAFRETFGVSPRRFLMLRRLAEARRELMRGQTPPGGRGELSVTEVATHWGFFHLGRFAQEYRLLYGESPSATLRAGRQRVLRVA